MDFLGKWSKIKFMPYPLLLNLVNTIKAEPFNLEPQGTIRVIACGRHLLLFKVKGQGPMQHAKYFC